MSASLKSADLHAFAHHWQDEADAAFLYRLLATLEPDASKSDVFRRLADVEDRHVTIWADLIVQNGGTVRAFHPTGRTRLLAFLGRRFGPGFLLPMLLSEEGREVKAYLDMHRATPKGAAGGDEALLLARESKEHAAEIAQLAGKHAEPWHQTESGGLLRNVVYGFNDGLTANFGLAAGVIGATVAAQHHAVIVAGVAGIVANSLSMGSSGYLAAKSQHEVYLNEIAMERDEIALMPEVERDELALIYEMKGMQKEQAYALATEVMADPERMLVEQVQEELKISGDPGSPMREAWITGVATAIGSFIPVAPFIFLDGASAIWLSFALAMGSHFLVGAMRSVFTGRGVIRSGMDMFVVGLGVAAIGYYVGEWISKAL
jgi:VIT1/CCC1 family predicted Fe2+/Mn2+ transporter